MKQFLVVLLLISSTFSNAAPVSDNLATALKKGNSTEISSYFGASVDLSIPENEGVFSKTQARLILKTFFLNNKPTGFNIVHNGDSKNNSHYSIGNLITLQLQQNQGISVLPQKADGKCGRGILFLKIRLQGLRVRLNGGFRFRCGQATTDKWN